MEILSKDTEIVIRFDDGFEARYPKKDFSFKMEGGAIMGRNDDAAVVYIISEDMVSNIQTSSIEDLFKKLQAIANEHPTAP